VPRNEASVEIARPAGDVFPYLLATDRRLRWMGALAESEKLSDGEPRLGTRFRDVFEDHGQRIEIDAEVVEWEPNARVATRLRSSAFEATARQTLEEVDGRTLVRTTIETEYRSRIARMMAGVITRHAQRRLEEDLKALKRLVEGGG
jgi:uncharacterized protein YndB with AHSA1/START domain